MFTFPESEYKWCTQCAGNIRKDADYCRFCKKKITSKLMQEVVFMPFMTVDSVSLWLPRFNTLVTKIADDLRKRFEQADIDSPPGDFGVPEGLTPMEYRIQNRETQESCLHEPPEPHELGLIYDMLLSMYEQGESLNELCDHPHLKLLEMTPQEVLAEAELRKEEREKNHKCEHCAEYIFPDDDECRFCSGRPGIAPKQAVDSFFNKTVDKHLLKDVILYEAAERTISGTTPIPQEILDANGITQENLDQEILRMRGSAAIKPMPRFAKRMFELGMNSSGFFSTESISISALVDLGSALDSKKVGRVDEALIVYEHGLKRTEGNDELTHERGRIYDYISFLYQGREDYVQYKKYHDLGQECKTFGMTDEMKELMDQSAMNNFDMLADDEGSEMDPEKRLERLDRIIGKSSEFLTKMVSHASDALPGLGEAMAAVGNAVDDSMMSARKILEGEIAKNNGDLAEAEKKFAEALELCGTGIGSSSRSSILLSLAEVKHLQGDDTTAEATLSEALNIANEYSEIMPEMGRLLVWKSHLAIAVFQSDTGKYIESEENFKLALKLQEESAEELMNKYGGNKEDYTGENANIMEPYAKLLRILNRNEEAEKLEIEAAEIRKEVEKVEAKRKEHKAKIVEQMKSDLPE